MMKPVRTLAAAIAAASLSTAYAGEAVFYVTEDGAAASNLAVTVDGKKKLVGKSGFVSFDLDGGNHSVELSEFGEWVGDFEFNAAKNQNAEIQVEMIGGEAVEEISVYTPGQEQAPAVGKISGNLESEETGGGVAGARISVEGTELATTTDNDGYYELELPRGEYTLVIADPNYGKREVKNLRVMSNVATSVNMSMSLSGDGVIEEVVAVGSYIPSTATAQERDSSAVLDAIGSEQFARFGDSSAASALKRVAGVSVVGGQFAVVRGMQGRYISSTLNGGLMPSTDPMRRDVPLDLFPASVLGGIEIQKSFSADLPGDSTGGAIRMTTKGLPSETANKVSVTLGLNSRTTFSDVNGYDGGSTDWLGVDDGNRELPSKADSITNGGKDEVNYCDVASLCLTPEQGVELSQSFENNYSVKQIEAKPEKGFSFSFSNADSILPMYGALQYKDKWSARHDANISDSGVNGTYERTKRNIDTTGYFVIGFESDSSTYVSKSTILRKTDDTVRTSSVYDDSKDQQIDKVVLQWVERQYLGQQFTGSHYFNIGDETQLDWRLGYSQTNRYEPDRRSYEYINENILTGSLERRFSDLTEDAWDVGFDLESVNMIGNVAELKLKAGVAYNKKDRVVDLGRFGIQVLDSANASQTGSLEDILTDTAYQNGIFAVTTRTTATDNYEAEDKLVASYVSGELDFEKFTVMGGVRSESFEQTLTYPQESSADNTLDGSDLLPVVSLNWRISEDLQLRASASNTLSRPGITERSASVQYDPETDDPLLGNPDLEVSKILNLDLRLEYYFSEEESVTLALFSKSVDSPIERSVINADGSASNGYTFRNEDSAEIQGLEIDFRKDLFEDGNWGGFVSGNFSFIDSEVQLDAESARLEGQSSRQLQGQSEVLGNVQLGLDHLPTGQSITFLVNYFDDRIYATGRGQRAEEVEDGRSTIDLVYRYDINDDLAVKAKATNITDEKVSFSRDDNVIESYYVGTDISASLEYIF